MFNGKYYCDILYEDQKRGKRTIRYMTHRCGKEKQKVTRQIFGIDGALEKYHAYQMIGEARKGTNFFRIVISPDPKKKILGVTCILARSQNKPC
jgi:hypothetical protein